MAEAGGLEGRAPRRQVGAQGLDGEEAPEGFSPAEVRSKNLRPMQPPDGAESACVSEVLRTVTSSAQSGTVGASMLEPMVEVISAALSETAADEAMDASFEATGARLRDVGSGLGDVKL